MRHAAAVALATLAGASGAAVAPAHASPAVVLLSDHVARSAPYDGAPRVGTVPGRTPLTAVRTVLPLLDGPSPAASWLHVRLPGRPNGRTGWIRSGRTRRSVTDWHITVRLGARSVVVRRDGRVARRFRAVVGAPVTPTPRGRFFVEEALALPGQAGGPYALATSARSEVLQEFAGGPGQIALHGTAGLAGAPGTAVSHGCVRLSTAAITWLARRVGAGTPLTVTR